MSCAADKDKGMNILLLLTLNNTLIIRTRGKELPLVYNLGIAGSMFYPPEKLDPAATTALHVSSSGAGAVRILPSMTIKSLFMGSGQQR